MEILPIKTTQIDLLTSTGERLRLLRNDTVHFFVLNLLERLEYYGAVNHSQVESISSLFSYSSDTLDKWFIESENGYLKRSENESENYGKISNETTEAIEKLGIVFKDVISIAKFYIENPSIKLPDPNKIREVSMKDIPVNFFTGRRKEFIIDNDEFIFFYNGFQSGAYLPRDDDKLFDISIKVKGGSDSGHIYFSSFTLFPYCPNNYSFSGLCINKPRKSNRKISPDFVVHIGEDVVFRAKADWYLTGLNILRKADILLDPKSWIVADIIQVISANINKFEINGVRIFKKDLNSKVKARIFGHQNDIVDPKIQQSV